jgi:putative salt-induced outer membrane protein
MLATLTLVLLGAAPPPPVAVTAATRRPAASRRRSHRRAVRRVAEDEAQWVGIQAPELVLPPFETVELMQAPPAIPKPEIPPEIRAMLDAAMESGDERGVDTIVKYARAGDPSSADLVLRRATEWREARARARDERVRTAGTFELWRGRIEAGGFVSSGNSNVTGLTGAADLTREGLRWRHRVIAQADFQRTDGITSRERYVLGYQPNYKIDDRGYIYGNGQFEADRFLGYVSRYSASVGAGYGVLRRSGLTLDIEVGPAFRQTDFTDETMQSSLAVRGSVNLHWTLVSGLLFTQDSAAYVERFNSTLRSVSAIEAKLLGPLSAKFSYTLQYESQPPAGRLTTDSITRASLVYSF